MTASLNTNFDFPIFCQHHNTSWKKFFHFDLSNKSRISFEIFSFPIIRNHTLISKTPSR